MSDLYKNKELKECKFGEEEIKECAGKMLSSMMKHDMRKAEGYKLVLMFCLRIFELQHEEKDKLITGIIKTVIFFMIDRAIAAPKLSEEENQVHSNQLLH